jgi:pimeloyl-ACP methyl ester carboxylesterase
LEIDTFVTVGWSGGGPHALACAALLADRCTACGVIAGLAPYPAPVRDWTEGKAGVVLRGDEDELRAAFDADREALAGLTGKDMAALFPARADAGALTGAYADWLADVIRSAYLNGSSGPRDDWKAFVSDWGFDLADARGVTLWQGDEDDIVPPAHAHWLKDHLPDSTLRLVSGEAHISIGLRLPEVIHDLTGRADPAL